jgi:hypothetical protein
MEQVIMASQMPMPFGDVPQEKGLPARIVAMHRLYGRCEGAICGTCQHMVMCGQGHSKRWYKCDLNMAAIRGPASDWLVGWPACGRWERGK